MKLRAVLFDVYGTLLEVLPPAEDADARWQALVASLPGPGPGPALTRAEFLAACHTVIARHHHAARTRGIACPEVQWPGVVGEVLPGFRQLPRVRQDDFVIRQVQTVHQTHLSPGVADLLKTLQARGLPLGIVSNSQAYTRTELADAMAPHGLHLGLFEPELCFWSFEHGFSKPDPHVFRVLEARLSARGVHPNETLMVGDRADNDIEPAHGVGWHAWLHVSGRTTWSQLAEWVNTTFLGAS